MKVPLLSCYVLTLNSERRLAQVLQSVSKVADEIIVVDSGSKDRTLQIADEYGARLLHRDFDNFRDQRVFAEDNCSYKWILALDSDEIISEELQQRIIQLKTNNFKILQRDPPDGFAIQRKWYFLGRNVRNFYPTRTPEYIVRLFQKEKLSHRGSRIIHEQLQTEGASLATIIEPIEHYTCDSIDDLYRKLPLYTTLSANDMKSKGEASNQLKIYLFPWLIWIQWHLFYGSWKDGMRGRILSKYIRDTVYVKYLKLRFLK